MFCQTVNSGIPVAACLLVLLCSASATAGQEQSNARSAGEWRQRLTAWRRTVATEGSGRDLRPASGAGDWVAKIDERSALPALKGLYEEEEKYALRQLFVEALARIGGEAAVRLLAEIACSDRNGPVRRQAATSLRGLGHADEAKQIFAQRPRPSIDHDVRASP